MTKKILGIVVILSVLLVIVVGIILINGNNIKNTPSSLSATNSNANTDVVKYNIELSNFAFNPTLIEMAPGSTIKVKLTNKTGLHDFVIDELNVRSSLLSGGQEETISITAPKDSLGKSYQFYCSVSNHRDMGMVGVVNIKSI